LAAILPSTCCVGLLLLHLLGFSGAWIGSLRWLEPLRPWFIGAAVLSLVFARRHLWRTATHCAPGSVCARPAVRNGYRWLCVLVLLALVFPQVVPWHY
jgi:mercuric ion transport protein